MKLSIIVPVYNVEKYIQKCMLSLLNQQLEDYEILLVDDGSLDHSIDIATSIQHPHQKFVKMLHKSNGGLSDARNFGIDHAKGDFIAFVDSDDYVDETMFPKMLEAAEKTKSDIVCCDMNYVHPNGEVNKSSAGDFLEDSVENNPKLLMMNNSACNKIYRRTLFDGLKFPLGMWYEDLALIPIILYRAKKIYHLEESLYFYVQRDSSIAHQISPKIFDIYLAIDKLDTYFKSANIQSDVWHPIYRHLILRHGAFLTTLRIKASPYWKERKDYMHQNALMIKRRIKGWFKFEELSEYHFKNRMVFWMIKHDLSWALATLLKGKQT